MRFWLSFLKPLLVRLHMSNSISKWAVHLIITISVIRQKNTYCGSYCSEGLTIVIWITIESVCSHTSLNIHSTFHLYRNVCFTGLGTCIYYFVLHDCAPGILTIFRNHHNFIQICLPKLENTSIEDIIQLWWEWECVLQLKGARLKHNKRHFFKNIFLFLFLFLQNHADILHEVDFQKKILSRKYYSFFYNRTLFFLNYLHFCLQLS